VGSPSPSWLTSVARCALTGEHRHQANLLRRGPGGSFVTRRSTAIPPVATPTAYLAVDCDLAAAGFRTTAPTTSPATWVDASVVIVNNSLPGPVGRLGALTVYVEDSDVSRLNPPPGADANLNGNPDFNEADMTGTWSCAGPAPDNDTGAAGPGKAVSTIGCIDVVPPTWPHSRLGRNSHFGSITTLPSLLGQRRRWGRWRTLKLGCGDCGRQPTRYCASATVHLFPCFKRRGDAGGASVVKCRRQQNNVDPSIGGRLWLCRPCAGGGA
jgi:hypothetical protein